MRTRTVLAAAALLALAAPLLTPGTAGAGKLPEHGYVTDTLVLPTNNTMAGQFGRNLDGSPGADNQLGQVLATLASQGFDLTGATSGSVTSGSLVMLHSLRTKSLKSSDAATWQVMYGDPVEEPDLSGDGIFGVSDTLPISTKLPATIKRHEVSTKAGNLYVALDLGAGVFRMQLAKGKVFATCGQAGCEDGRINGGVRKTEVNGVLIPALVQLFAPIIVRDCPGAEASSCADGSTGETILRLFDADHDMVVTSTEIKHNDLIKALFAPDLDLFDKNGKPGQDGKADCLSFGIGFTAVPATIKR